MSRKDVLQPVVPANQIKNGSMVVLAFETGLFQQRDPDFNHFTASGDIYNQYKNKFLPYYDDPDNKGGKLQSFVFTTNSTSTPFEANGDVWVNTIGTFGGGELAIEASFDGGLNFGTVYTFTFGTGEADARLLEFPQNSVVRATLSGSTSPNGTMQVRY